MREGSNGQEKSCRTCRWWVPYRHDGEEMVEYGECHGAPPKESDRWPRTNSYDWCAGWAAKNV